MGDRDLTVYRTTHPDALAAWHTAAEARQVWGEQMKAFLDEHGFGDRNVYISHHGRPLGITHADGDPVPDGWRIDSRTGHLMPRLATRAGKKIEARLGELRQPDPRHNMPGMPMECFVSRALLTCGMRIIGGALYVEWGRLIPEDLIDLKVWQPVKLSEYYRALEANEEAEAVANRG